MVEEPSVALRLFWSDGDSVAPIDPSPKSPFVEPIELDPEDMESPDSEPEMPGDVDDRPLPVVLPPIEAPPL